MSDEITVKINCSLEEMYNILKNKGFSIVDKYILEDTYYVLNNIDISKQPIREVLKKYILIRNIIQFVPDDFINSYNIVKMTFKSKNIAQDGTIVSQDKQDCEIQNIEQGKEFIKSIGYKEIMTIKENTVVYKKDNLNLAIKNVVNGDNLIEIECNNEYKTINELKRKISELNIPIDKSNFFVKKAEIEIKKILGDL